MTEEVSNVMNRPAAPASLPAASDSDARSVPSGAGAETGAAARRVRLLVSACLLGEKVRYDGQHKYDGFVAEMLGPHVQWERVCPEVDCGMPTPRPSMHLVGDPASPRLISRTGADLTEQMQSFVEGKLDQLARTELCGYICKKDSPSSGMARVKVYDGNGRAARVGAGLFTAAFMRRFPLVPVEEEGRLQDARLREAFIERVFCRRRWLDLVAGGRDRGRLVEFHADHKFLLLAHGRAGHAQLGRLVASAKQYRTGELFATYETGFVAALSARATIKKTTDVLAHMLGFFRKQLTADEKAELLETIEAYRQEQVPLIVPLTLLKHYVRKYEVGYLARQVFLSPYPAELMLRNHV
jgi:uncharacterized protein YbgA (DUF1722 family)/uncharacterized protein YbbK (DUF523 family)